MSILSFRSPCPLELAHSMAWKPTSKGVGIHGISVGSSHCPVDYSLRADLQRPRHLVHADPRKGLGQCGETQRGAQNIGTETSRWNRKLVYASRPLNFPDKKASPLSERRLGAIVYL